MKTLIPFFVCTALFFFACATKNNENNNNQKPMDIKSEPKAEWLYGQIVTESFVNKIGKEMPEYQEYYFRHAGENYFIKLSECKTDVNMSSLVGQYVKVKGEFLDGLWDTNDPNVQSRIGTYFVFSQLDVIVQPMQVMFSDGSNNMYLITPEFLKYEPVMPEHSSSGVYSGGDKKEAELDVDVFMDVYFEALKMYDLELTIEDRVKGSGSITIVFEESDDRFIIKNCKELEEFQTKLDSLFE